ncbi:MAG: hypothetical protein FWH39_02895 [Bacteroidales bacterium]|nr:hypothetical protein [Bacteroidales bacterium]
MQFLQHRFGCPKEKLNEGIKAESLIYPSPMATPWANDAHKPIRASFAFIIPPM